MSVEEKIRRAEEIYQKRKQGEIRQVAKVTVNNKKDIKLLKKMLIQILICAAIYLIVYTIQNNQYVFSEDFINKANEILSYDTNFVELYEMFKSQTMNFMNQELTQEMKEEAIGGAEQEKQAEPQEQTNQEEQLNEGEENSEVNTQEENGENLSQTEIDIINIKNTTSFIKPVEGSISSKYGYRDTATGSVPKNHTGIDIAANTGTKIRAATDGEVVLASEEGDYRETFENSDRRSEYYLCSL